MHRAPSPKSIQSSLLWRYLIFLHSVIVSMCLPTILHDINQYKPLPYSETEGVSTGNVIFELSIAVYDWGSASGNTHKVQNTAYISISWGETRDTSVVIFGVVYVFY